jgi:kojibiose phosphorylase
MTENWSIVEPRFDVSTAKGQEGLLTLGSGYLHVRGSLEEHLHDAPQHVTYLRKPANVTAERFPDMKVKWGTFVPGIYGQHPLMGKEMANLPSFISLVPSVAGEKLDMETSRISGYERRLDLRTATLTRRLRWHTAAGVDIDVVFERFISAAQPHLSLQRLHLTAHADTALDLTGGIDTDVRTSGYDHFVDVTLTNLRADQIQCAVTLDSGDSVQMLTWLSAPTSRWYYDASHRAAHLSTTLQLVAGQTLTVEKRTAVTTSFDREPLALESLLLESDPYNAVHADHVAIWAQRWQQADVIIEGDDEAQQQLRVGLYHLLRAHPQDPRVAIDPKAYAGDAYRGLYFWDTEMYMMPFFLYTQPDAARSLLDFRLNTLEGAKANAASFGYPGAKYPWEGDARGDDHCPAWQYKDHEVHVTADVVYGIAHYARATGDMAYLTEQARDVLRETARFWVARVDWRSGDGYASLLGVMGPDEYAPITDNNAYTNRLVSLALQYSAQVEPDAEQRDLYNRIAQSLPIFRMGDVVLQHEQFDRMAEFDFDAFWHDRSRPIAAQVSQERLYRSKAMKQADVLLLMMLFPDEFSEAEVRAAWDYYLPHTTHDSSLSPGVHAVVAARLGMLEQSLAFWRQSLSIDTGNGAAEGIHIAAHGINWQIAVMGFGGLRDAMNADFLTLSPVLPPGWSRLAFPLVWHGQSLMVDVRPDSVTVENRSTEPLAVHIYATDWTIAPGERVVVEPLRAI